jgi:hypothetical protein
MIIDDLLKLFLGALPRNADSYETRAVGRDASDGLIISTAFTTDYGFETAIISADKVRVVARWRSKEEAEIGHIEWCSKVVGMETVIALGYGELISDERVKLSRLPDDEIKERMQGWEHLQLTKKKLH